MTATDLKRAYAELSIASSLWAIALSAQQRALIDRYMIDVLAYNEKTNLTADTDPEILLLRHIADGVAAAGLLKAELTVAAPRVLDLGSGAGFIGITMKILWPDAEVTLMESRQRRYQFLSSIAAHGNFKGLRVVHKHADGTTPASRYEKDFDVVIERAVAPLPEALTLAFPLAARTGVVVAFQSTQPHSDGELNKVLEKLPARLLKSIPYRLPREAADRHLAVFARL